MKYHCNKGDKCCCETIQKCDCEIIHQDVVDKVKKRILDEEILLLMADFYKALSDSTRMKIIDVLYEGEMCVCDISVLINMTKSAISHQLKYLKDMNLIKSRKQGKEVFYSLADRHIVEVFEISKEHILEAKNEKNC